MEGMRTVFTIITPAQAMQRDLGVGGWGGDSACWSRKWEEKKGLFGIGHLSDSSKAPP